MLIFIIAFALRAGYAFLEKPQPYADAVGFDKMGWHIAQGQGYRISDGPIEEDRSIAHPPGYAFFLGIIYKIFGHSYPAVWLIQAILSALSCILIYLIAKKLFGINVARIAAVISAVFFIFVLYSALLFSETLFVFLLLLCFIFIYQADVRRTDLGYPIAGILAALCILTRVIILPFFLLFGLVCFARKINKAVLFFLPIIVLIMPWGIRNYSIYHSFVPVCAGGGETLWCGHHALATGRYDMPMEIEEYRLRYNIPETEDPGGLLYIKIDHLGYRKGAEFIIAHPFKTAALEIKKIFLFFNLFRTDIWWPHIKGIGRILSFIFLILSNFFIFAFGILGLVFSYTVKNRYISWMRKFIYISVLSLIPFIIEPRYRLVIYPFLIIFSSYAITLIPKIRHAFLKNDKQTKRLAYIAIFIFFLVVLASLSDFIGRSSHIFYKLKMLVSHEELL